MMGLFLKQLGSLLVGQMAGSNNKAAFIVKTFRGLYIVSGGTIIVIWYSAYRNERVSPGEIDFPIPLVSQKKRIGPPDRPEPERESGGEGHQRASSVMPGGQVAESIGGNEPHNLLKVVNWINSVSGKYPYVWGGGHSQIGVPSGGGFDCSGAVSGAVGQLPGVLSTPLTSGQFADVFPGGEGKYITIYGNSVHVFMKIKINGVWHWFGTGSDKQALRGGPAWGNNDFADAKQYQVSHPPGY